MKVLVDDKIPYIKEAIERIADEVVYLPGGRIAPEDVRDVDALIVRTRTRCDRRLLAGSRVRFIATATIGFDHIDTAYCREAGIEWANAPGCNAASVAQYVQSALLLLQRERGVRLAGACLGVVGVGHVGRRVEAVGRALGMEVLRCDPPRARQEGPDGFVGLDEIARRADVVSFHTPLIREGAYRTFHLADEAFFRSLERRPVLLNTSRGEVVDTEALKQAWRADRLRAMVLDVWEHEPDIDRWLLGEAFLATPHIAGYSADGKANATRMALEALCRFFRLDPCFHIEPPAPACPVLRAATADEALLQMYDPRRDTEALRRAPACFEQLRGDYPLRREACAYRVELGGRERAGQGGA